MDKYDFTGWSTRYGVKCSDGRTIQKDAFKDNDGMVIPLVWNHQHNEPDNVLGHCLLENRDEGVYIYGSFNDTEEGMRAKRLVEHGDITQLSIYANKLKEMSGNVLHGAIREVSLVLAGANPSAFIDSVVCHGDDSDDGEAFIYSGEDISLEHAEEATNATEQNEPAKETEKEPVENEKKSDGEETIGDIMETLTEKQKLVLYALVGKALEDKTEPETEVKHSETTESTETTDNKEGDQSMKHNVFDQNDQTTNENVISHSDMEAVIKDAKSHGSMKDSALAHGIDHIDYLFPEATNLNKTPEFISRDMGWVTGVMGGVHHTPFSKIKSMAANITADEARAKGYIKGNLKMDEVFTLLKRSTTPTTIYKKQKFDRDDVIDITDFDVLAWVKTEMRVMLDEEIARAILVGDGRLGSSDDKINESNIRPIWKDDDLYTVKKIVSNSSTATDSDKAKAFIKACIKSRKDYKGSGNPTLYTTEDMLTNCLLIEDTTGRIIYESEAKLATTLRVKNIVTVPVMENLTRTVDGATHTLDGIIVNLTDYNVGADKGGAVNMFDDFDIDYNQEKYLIETRCSGALIKPYSAIVVESKTV